MKAVREWMKSLGECAYCGDNGSRLISFVGRPMHARCIAWAHGLAVLAMVPEAKDNIGICCFGVRGMKKLMVLWDREASR